MNKIIKKPVTEVTEFTCWNCEAVWETDEYVPSAIKIRERGPSLLGYLGFGERAVPGFHLKAECPVCGWVNHLRIYV